MSHKQKEKAQVCTRNKDVCEFYPSITPKLLNNALKFASKFVNIPEKDAKMAF